MKKKYLNKFIQNYKDVFGVQLSEADALRMAEQLLELYRSVYGEISGDYKSNKNKNDR